MTQALRWLLETTLVVLMSAMVLVVTWQVVSRYVLARPSSYTEELAIFLMIWIGLLGAGLAVYRGAHLGIDYFTNKLPPHRRVLSELLVLAIVALFAAFCMLWGGIQLVNITLMTNQVSPALQIRMGYIYLAMPISGAFITYFSVLFFIEKWRSWRFGVPPTLSPKGKGDVGTA